MKKMFSIIITAAGLLLFSCKKETINDPVNNPVNSPATSKVKMQVGAVTTTTYYYDAAGRLILGELTDGSKFQFEYPAGQVIYKSYAPDGTLSNHDIYELNSDGLAIKLTKPLSPGY